MVISLGVYAKLLQYNQLVDESEDVVVHEEKE
jgi:hypothetical protein